MKCPHCSCENVKKASKIFKKEKTQTKAFSNSRTIYNRNDFNWSLPNSTTLAMGSLNPPKPKKIFSYFVIFFLSCNFAIPTSIKVALETLNFETFAPLKFLAKNGVGKIELNIIFGLSILLFCILIPVTVTRKVYKRDKRKYFSALRKWGKKWYCPNCKCTFTPDKCNISK